MNKPPYKSTGKSPRNASGNFSGNFTTGGSPEKRPSEDHDRHHAEKRRLRRETVQADRARKGEPVHRADEHEGKHFLYGLHTVRHALQNPRRVKHALHATRNALARLDESGALFEGVIVRETDPRELDKMVGSDAVHQGAVLETEPLAPRTMAELGEGDLLLVLDQITDPHNVGAILRSATALGARGVIVTTRHSPDESGVLAKAASGALEMIELAQVRNLAQALEELAALGFQTIGLDSEGPSTLEESLKQSERPGKIALVLGAEGKGLRQKTRETCTALARIDMPGPIKSLNVSNAAALALYAARRALSRPV